MGYWVLFFYTTLRINQIRGPEGQRSEVNEAFLYCVQWRGWGCHLDGLRWEDVVGSQQLPPCSSVRHDEPGPGFRHCSPHLIRPEECLHFSHVSSSLFLKKIINSCKFDIILLFYKYCISILYKFISIFTYCTRFKPTKYASIINWAMLLADMSHFLHLRGKAMWINQFLAPLLVGLNVFDGSKAAEMETQSVVSGSKSFHGCWWPLQMASSSSIMWIHRKEASASWLTNTGEGTPDFPKAEWKLKRNVKLHTHFSSHSM